MTRQPSIFSHCRAQAGLTLQELMIAIAIGLLLVAGMMTILLGSGQSDRLMTETARMQENSRFAIEAIGRELRMAGYRTDITVERASAFPAGGSFTSAGQVISGTDTTISVRYQGSADGTVRDCLGNTVGAGTTATITLSVNADQELICQSSLGGSEVLIDQIEAMQIRYGVDGAATYTTAASVANWDAVASVNVELLLVSSRDGITTAPQPYTIGGTTTTPDDRRLRRVYSSVISLRNRT